MDEGERTPLSRAVPRRPARQPNRLDPGAVLRGQRANRPGRRERPSFVAPAAIGRAFAEVVDGDQESAVDEAACRCSGRRWICLGGRRRRRTMEAASHILVVGRGGALVVAVVLVAARVVCIPAAVCGGGLAAAGRQAEWFAETAQRMPPAATALRRPAARASQRRIAETASRSPSAMTALGRPAAHSTRRRIAEVPPWGPPAMTPAQLPARKRGGPLTTEGAGGRRRRRAPMPWSMRTTGPAAEERRVVVDARRLSCSSTAFVAVSTSDCSICIFSSA
jgi:hypothetical protein